MQQTNQQPITKTQLKGTKATLQTLPHIEQICCRICLQDMSPQEIFQVCKCKGANSHVHERCLLEWAKKTQKYRESFDKYFYHCQICKDKILLEVVTKLKCLKCRHVTFCGQDSCCTFSALTILFMGLAMFIAGLYLKVTSANSDVEYLFDLTLSLSVIIISFDLMLSILYFLLYNEVIVVGILLSEEQRANIRLKQKKVSNSHQEKESESKKGKKQRNENINQTEAFFMEQDHGQQVRQILQEARFQTLNGQQQQNQSPPRQRILFPENQNLQILPTTNQQPHQSTTIHNQTQSIKPKPQPLNSDNHPHTQSLPQNQQTHQQNQNNQSLIRNQPQNINQHNYSTSTVIQYQTRSIMVRSISIKSRGDYKNNLSSYNSTPMNDQSSTFSNIQNEIISHNQIPTPKSLMIKKPSPLNRFRKTLDQSLVRSEIHLMEQKRKYYGDDKVSEEGQEIQNDVEILFMEASNKKLSPTFQNGSSEKKLIRQLVGTEQQIN